MRYFNKDEQKTTINEAHYDNDDGDCDGVIDLHTYIPFATTKTATFITI